MITTTITHTSAPTKLIKLASSLGALLLLPLTWMKRIRNRRELMRLMEQPEYLMKDVGLQRDEIVREAIKRFWVA
jgi:uncharacterized protein YjiS (DUF1127 family)